MENYEIETMAHDRCVVDMEGCYGFCVPEFGHRVWLWEVIEFDSFEWTSIQLVSVVFYFSLKLHLLVLIALAGVEMIYLCASFKCSS